MTREFGSTPADAVNFKKETRAPYYEPTAEDPQYLGIVKDFIGRNRKMFSEPGGIYLDFGGGTGVAAREIQALYPEVPAVIIVVDPNEASIEAGREQTNNSGPRKIKFVHGSSDELSTLGIEGAVSGVVIANAIHELPDEKRVDILKAINKTMRDGGRFISNSTFTKESMEGVEAHWGRWKVGIKSELQAEREIKASERTEDHVPFVTHPASRYEEQLREAGFRVEGDPNIIEVQVHAPLMKAIATYDTFIEGMCGDLKPSTARVEEIVQEIAQSTEDSSILDLSYEEKVKKVKSAVAIRTVDKMKAAYDSKNQGKDAPEFYLPRKWVELSAVKAERSR